MTNNELDKDKGIKDFPVNESNPFLDTLQITTKKKTVAISKKKLMLQNVSTDEGEIAFIGIREEVDNEKFAKIYLSQIQALFDLTLCGIRVFGYFATTSKINADKAFFDLEECMKFTNYKNKQSVYNGIKELLERGFIARTKSPNIYYINICIFFNGNRMVVIKEYVATRALNNPNDANLDDALRMSFVNSASKTVSKAKKRTNKTYTENAPPTEETE